MVQRVERCSESSEDRAEPMAGTASVVRSWLLLEHPGPWGQDAFVDARLPNGFAAELSQRCRAAGVRPLLIRRVAAREPAVRCFAIRSGPEPPWIEATTVPALTDVLDLDVDALGRGRTLGVERHTDPLFLVCTHGRHDRCCAERGRPLAHALAAAFPANTWESSHFGGDRFAGNVIAFPHGVYFGRVEPTGAERVAGAYTAGRLELDHLRGRSCYPMAVQAAELELRAVERLVNVDEVSFESADRSSARVVARFGTPRGRFEVEIDVDVGEADASFLTCRSEARRPAPRYRLVEIRRLD